MSSKDEIIEVSFFEYEVEYKKKDSQVNRS